jgi:DNA repair protein RadC
MNLKEGTHKIDRPREKLEKYGPDKLSDSELLAILLRTGTKGMNVVEMSKKILKKFSGVGLASASFAELKSTFGLGAAKACEVIACFELGRRLLKDKKTTLLLSPEEVWAELKDIRDHKKEHFVVFYLDTRNQTIKRETISIGTLNSSLVHPREVFEPAIKHSAAQVLIAHNHPSGSTDPSQEDIEVTKRLVEAGKLLGIEVVDHVIVAKNGFGSCI